MKVSTQDIPAIMAQYIDSQVAPQANGVQKFGIYSLMYAVNNKMTDIVTRYSPIMKMVGIMDDSGVIDLEYTHGMAADAMSHAGKVNVLGFLMDSSDVEAIYNIAQRYGK